MPALALNPQKTALVAIDLQNAIVAYNTAPYAAADVVRNSRAIADALRAKGGTVVWVRVDFNHALTLSVDQPSPMAGRKIPEELQELTTGIGRCEDDLVVTKPHWGAFAGTTLELQLRERGIDAVVLTGISTNVGVESTLRQGTGLGFAFVTVEDACAAQDAQAHHDAFARIFPRLARVRSTQEVLDALA